MGTRRNCLYWRVDLYTQQQEAERMNIMGKSQWSRHRLFRTTKNDGTSQKKLLVAGIQRRH